jgi:hypothetical protein
MWQCSPAAAPALPQGLRMPAECVQVGQQLGARTFVYHSSSSSSSSKASEPVPLHTKRNHTHKRLGYQLHARQRRHKACVLLVERVPAVATAVQALVGTTTHCTPTTPRCLITCLPGTSPGKSPHNCTWTLKITHLKSSGVRPAKRATRCCCATSGTADAPCAALRALQSFRG